MSLKLVHRTNGTPGIQAELHPKRLTKVCWLAATCFLILKFPMCFSSLSPEELRDFEAYMRVAEGQIPYRDFVWQYGPLTPWIYGLLLKIFPEALLTVRIAGTLIWAVGVFYLGKILARYLASGRAVFFGSLFASFCAGYPSYAHNHVVASVAAILSIYYLLEFLEESTAKALLLSFLYVLTCFYSRPVLMGYGVLGAWFVIFVSQSKANARVFVAISFLTAISFITFLFFPLCGPGVKAAFVPTAWRILLWAGYPNIHYLVPSLSGQPDMILALANWLKGALQTGMFYLHYFIWPTFILTLAFNQQFNLRIRAAALCAVVSFLAAFDLLHYGFPDEQV